jgi:hypothetical protein
MNQLTLKVEQPPLTRGGIGYDCADSHLERELSWSPD